MQQDIQTQKQKCNAMMTALCACQVWWSRVHVPWECCQFCPTPKIACENVLYHH